MNKILNWVFGSFFRTLGRLLVFILLGFILAQFINFKDIKITDLLGFEKVNATTLTTEVIPGNDGYISTSNLGIMTKVLGSTSGRTQQTFELSIAGSDMSGSDYVEFNIIPNYAHVGFSLDDSTEYYCTEYDIIPSSYGYTMACSNYQYNSNIVSRVNNSSQFKVENISVKLIYEYDNDYSTCDFQDSDTLICPTHGKNNATRLQFNYIFQSSYETTFYFQIQSRFKLYSISGITGAINNQTGAINNQTQQQHQDSQNTQNAINNVNDSLTNNSTSDASNSAGSFFDNFNDNDHGLSSIITAPLRAINAMLNDTCVAPGATYKGQSFSLPCGSMLWNREGGQDFRNFINIMYGGFLAYFVIRSLFLDIEKLKNPNNDKVEVESL